MQGKYLAQLLDLYEDFYISFVPQKEEEQRGIKGLKNFGKMLISALE